MKKASLLWITPGLAVPTFTQPDSTRTVPGVVTVQGNQTNLLGVEIAIKGTSLGTYLEARNYFVNEPG